MSTQAVTVKQSDELKISEIQPIRVCRMSLVGSEEAVHGRVGFVERLKLFHQMFTARFLDLPLFYFRSDYFDAPKTINGIFSSRMRGVCNSSTSGATSDI